jgi:hypothetical protein
VSANELRSGRCQMLHNYHDGKGCRRFEVDCLERPDIPGLALTNTNGWWVVTHAPSGFAVIDTSSTRIAAEWTLAELGKAAVDWTRSKQNVQGDPAAKEAADSVLKRLRDTPSIPIEVPLDADDLAELAETDVGHLPIQLCERIARRVHRAVVDREHGGES